MSETVTDDTTAPASDQAEEHAPADHEHPSEWAYVKIAAVLAVVTGLEVSTYFRSVVNWGDALIPSLMVMMLLKFWLVATWFMHLKFDNPLFGRLFWSGLLLAGAVYIVTLTAFEFWA
ncbi:MAG: cytochrome C oxidase subunit IV family protein [Acidimicrobiales bacterium]